MWQVKFPVLFLSCLLFYCVTVNIMFLKILTYWLLYIYSYIVDKCNLMFWCWNIALSHKNHTFFLSQNLKPFSFFLENCQFFKFLKFGSFFTCIKIMNLILLFFFMMCISTFAAKNGHFYRAQKLHNFYVFKILK